MDAPSLDEIDATLQLYWGSLACKRHMPDYSRARDWKAVVSETGGKKPIAKYIHTLTHEAIHRIEQECLTGAGTVVKGDTRNGIFWRELQQVVGASRGEETRFVRVEVTSGAYRGRPVTWKELQTLFKVAGGDQS